MYCEEYVLRVLCVSRGSVLRILPVLPSISCFSTAGTYLPGVPYCSYSQYTTLSSWAFLSTRIMWAFSVLAIFWPPVLQYSQDSDYELFWSIYYCENYIYSERQETYFGGVYFVCAESFLLSRSQSIMSQPRPRATFHTYVYAASIKLMVASHLSRINIHFDQYTLFYVIEMVPHYFHKQQYIVCPQKYVCVLHINDEWMQLLMVLRNNVTGVQVFHTSVFSFSRHPPRHLPEGNLVPCITGSENNECNFRPKRFQTTHQVSLVYWGRLLL